nr:MAG TPA: hypothetical protein [Bacteriophage sp.]
MIARERLTQSLYPCSLPTSNQNTIHYIRYSLPYQLATLVNTVNSILLVNIIYYHYIVENSKYISV